MVLLMVLPLSWLVCKLSRLMEAAGVDTGDMNAEDVAELFGNTQGFKQSDVNVTPTEDNDESDF